MMHDLWADWIIILTDLALDSYKPSWRARVPCQSTACHFASDHPRMFREPHRAAPASFTGNRTGCVFQQFLCVWLEADHGPGVLKVSLVCPR